MGRPKAGVTAEQRVFGQLTESGDCWEWQGYRMPAGHGRVRVDGRKVLVHRWVWEFLVCPLPEGLELDHLCRNPPCSNPLHLDPVPHRVNTLRGVGRGAVNATKTHCPHGHRYDEVNTYVYRGKRYCRRCNVDRPQSAHDGGPGCAGNRSVGGA
jgi:hypothetical protein